MFRIQLHVAIADAGSARHGIFVARHPTCSHTLARPVMAIEPARFHRGADRWIERAIRFLGDGTREADGLEDDRTDGDRLAVPSRNSLSRELRDLAIGVEPRAARFDLVKPPERALDRIVESRRRVDRDERAHGHDGGAHLAFLSASVTAS